MSGSLIQAAPGSLALRTDNPRVRKTNDDPVAPHAHRQQRQLWILQWPRSGFRRVDALTSLIRLYLHFYAHKNVELRTYLRNIVPQNR
jgi:hypothetical protein